MKSHKRVFRLKTEDRQDVVNVTGRVQETLRESGIREGLLLVYPLHTSSAVYISDSDASLTLDFLDVTDRLVPDRAGYRHDETDYKKNAAAHLKAILCGHHVTIPVTDGALDLGVYQTVYYAEFDGGREKEFLIKIIGE
jgi:secondary thiamine-phosphate synthase enzyme